MDDASRSQAKVFVRIQCKAEERLLLDRVREEGTLVWILGLAGFISAADNWIVSPVLPAIADSCRVSIATAGAILTAYLIPYGIMQPVYGFFSDHWGKKKILCRVIFGLAFGTLGCAFSGSITSLCFWRFLTGFFAAGIIAVSLALIGDQVAAPNRQACVGKFMGIVFLGQGLSVGFGGAFARYLSWRSAFIVFAIIAGSVGLLLVRKLPNDQTKEPAVAVPMNFIAAVWQALVSSTGRVIFPAALITGFLLLGLYSYLGAFLHDVTGLDYFQVGIVVMCYGFACLLAGRLVGHIQRRLQVKPVVLIGFSFACFTSALLLFAHSWQAGLLATVSLGFGYIFVQSILATLAFNIEPKGLPSALIGLGLFGGGGLGTAFAGGILARWNYHILWMVLGVGIIGALALSAVLRFPELLVQDSPQNSDKEMASCGRSSD